MTHLETKSQPWLDEHCLNLLQSKPFAHFAFFSSMHESADSMLLKSTDDNQRVSLALESTALYFRPEGHLL